MDNRITGVFESQSAHGFYTKKMHGPQRIQMDNRPQYKNTR